jgi:hypothetical protein
VLLVVSSVEFGDCREGAGSWFNVDEADAFVFGDTSRLSFYLKFFNVTSLARNAVGLPRRRTDRTAEDSFVLNQFGDAPVNLTGDLRQFYLKPALDKRCFAALRRTARSLDARGIQLALVESPMNPKWRKEFDPSGELTPLTRRKVREAFTGTNAVLIEDRTGFSSADFYDAVHVTASSTPRFTRSVLAQLAELERSGSNALP